MGTGDDKNLFPQDQDGKVIQDRNTDLLSLWKVHVFNAFKIRILTGIFPLVDTMSLNKNLSSYTRGQY